MLLYNANEMSQPMRSRRGILVPGIDTHSPGDQEYHQPQQERAFSPWPLTPSSSQDSRRPSLALSSFYDGSLSGASSVSSFSQPATPMHSMASSTENFHRQWHDAAAEMHVSMADALESTCMMSQPEPMFNTGFQPHGLPMATPLSLPNRPVQMATASPARNNAWNHTPQGSFNGSGLGDAVYQSLSGVVHQQTPTTPMCASPTGPTQTPAQQSMFPGYNAMNAYQQQPQVVVPSQLGPQNAYHMDQYHGYGQDERSARAISQSFDSVDAQPWVPVASQSPVQVCTSPINNGYDMVKREFVGSPSSSSEWASPRNSPAFAQHQAPSSSARKARKSKHGEIFGHAFNAGIEIEYAGPRWTMHTDESGKVHIHTNSTKRVKPHRCDFIKADGTECGSSFDRSEHLKRHAKSHGGPKDPCPLPECKWEITRSDNMCQHLRTHIRKPGKGVRNKFWTLDDVCYQIMRHPHYDEKKANKLITNLRKPQREKTERKHPRSNNRKRGCYGSDESPFTM